MSKSRHEIEWRNPTRMVPRNRDDSRDSILDVDFQIFWKPLSSHAYANCFPYYHGGSRCWCRRRHGCPCQSHDLQEGTFRPICYNICRATDPWWWMTSMTTSWSATSGFASRTRSTRRCARRWICRTNRRSKSNMNLCYDVLFSKTNTCAHIISQRSQRDYKRTSSQE